MIHFLGQGQEFGPYEVRGPRTVYVFVFYNFGRCPRLFCSESLNTFRRVSDTSIW